MFENFVIFILQALFLTLMIALVFAVFWMMFQAAKFLMIVLEIHSTASKKPHGHIFALANFFDARILDDKEKKLRDEGFLILNRIMIVAFIFSAILVTMVLFTSK